MKEKLKSRKLWVTLVAGIVVALNDAFGFGLDKDTIYSLVSLVVGYVFSQGIVDVTNKQQ